VKSVVDADAFNAFEAAGWNTRAATYGASLGGVTSRLAEPLLDAAGVGGGTRTLDVATGPGYVAALASDRGAEVVGVDVAPAMVAAARELRPDLDFRLGDVERLPFGDASFDAVVCNFGLLHFGRPERAAEELARVLAPGGRLALTVWDDPARMRLTGVLFDALASVGVRGAADVPDGPPIFRFADEAEFRALLEGAGLVDAAIDTISFAVPRGEPNELWSRLLDGTVRARAILLAQTSDVQQRVRAAFDEIVAAEPDELGVSVKLGHAARGG
jgi:SAM-dependent methyltransferase